MTISREKFDEICADETNLTKFIAMLEHGYSWLSAKCQHALGGVNDGTEEEDEEEEGEVDAEMDLPPEDMRRAIIKAKASALDDFDPSKSREHGSEEDLEFIENNPNEPERKAEQLTVAIGDMYRMIKQLSHPDKLLKYSAVDKQKILDIFHESTEFMEDENLEALVFSYVKLRIIRHEPHKIPEYIESYVRTRHSQILRHMAFLMQKPFTPAILEWRDGNEAWAVILFKRYLKEESRKSDLEREREQSDDEYFNS